MKKSVLKFAAEHLADAFALACLAAVTRGIAAIHRPSAWIAAGVFGLAFLSFIEYNRARAERGRRQ